MTKREAREIAGSLTTTSKMPCHSIDLPVKDCKVGNLLMSNKDSICHGCYAAKGFAKMYAKNIDPAREYRLKGLTHPKWVEAMIVLIGKDPYFRWHSAGDIQDLQHLRNIVKVCNGTPNTKHWLPTRQYNEVRQFRQEGGKIPSNLVIRLSAYLVDSKPPQPFLLEDLPTSTVNRKTEPIGKACAAQFQQGKCLSCRSCWSKEESNISYYYH